MLLYTHLVWTAELPAFFSSDGVFSDAYRSDFTGGSPWSWSHFGWFDSPVWLWGTHIVSLLILMAFAVGLWTRFTGVMAFLIVVSYANRAGGALFGLDQINGFLALYLAIAPCGAMYSVDAWLKRRPRTRKNELADTPGAISASPSTMATLSTRLIQIHLCVVYLFAGLGKLQGISWWEGTALWGAFASYEYQTVDMTWLVHMPWLVNILTLVSVFWEFSYPFLIWPKLTRPVYLLMAVLIHLGIGMCMGMITFGLIMIFANMSFVSPRIVEDWMGRLTGLMRRFSASATRSG